MLSEAESNSIHETIETLNRGLASLLSRHRDGVDLQAEVVALSEALEKLEDLVLGEIVRTE